VVHPPTTLWRPASDQLLSEGTRTEVDGVGQDEAGDDSPYEASEARWFSGGNGGVPAPVAAPMVVDGGGSSLQHRGRGEGVRHTG
jgi:hypothetical protein